MVGIYYHEEMFTDRQPDHAPRKKRAPRKE
jgi:hypothetical protein